MKVYDGNKSALGWCLDAIARVIGFIAPAVFLSVTILRLAKLDAGCSVDTNEECTNRVYGLRPSSYITTFATIVGVCSASCLPFVGAIIDYTCHRKLIGFVTALAQVGFTTGQIWIQEGNWFGMFIAQVFNAFVGWIHTLCAYAYLPELTQNEGKLVKWTASFNVWQYVSMVVFLVYMIGILQLLGFSGIEDESDDTNADADADENTTLDYIYSSRVASISALAVITPCYLIAWTCLMTKRTAIKTLPEGSSLYTIGFIKVYRTSQTLFQRYRPVMWFFLNVACVEAAQQSIATISLTYMTDTLQMTTVECGIAILLLFVFGIVGALIGQVSISTTSSSSSSSPPADVSSSTTAFWKINPLRSLQLCQIFAVGATAMAVLLLWKPGQQYQAYGVAAAWGTAAGWKNTVERFTVVQIIPKHAHAEMMGFYLFSTQVIAWLPTLIFTTLNEAGVSQRISICTLIFFFGVGFVCLFKMGSYDDVVRLAGITSSSDDEGGDINKEDAVEGTTTIENMNEVQGS